MTAEIGEKVNVSNRSRSLNPLFNLKTSNLFHLKISVSYYSICLLIYEASRKRILSSLLYSNEVYGIQLTE